MNRCSFETLWLKLEDKLMLYVLLLSVAEQRCGPVVSVWFSDARLPWQPATVSGEIQQAYPLQSRCKILFKGAGGWRVTHCTCSGSSDVLSAYTGIRTVCVQYIQHVRMYIHMYMLYAWTDLQLYVLFKWCTCFNTCVQYMASYVHTVHITICMYNYFMVTLLIFLITHSVQALLRWRPCTSRCFPSCYDGWRMTSWTTCHPR